MGLHIENAEWYRRLRRPQYRSWIGIPATPPTAFLENPGISRFFAHLVATERSRTVAALLLGRASAPYVLAFLADAFALGISLSFAAVGLEELGFRRYPRMRDLATLLVVAVAENVGYRQLSIW